MAGAAGRCDVDFLAVDKVGGQDQMVDKGGGMSVGRALIRRSLAWLADMSNCWSFGEESDERSGYAGV
jgi:hypothetical protein